MKKTWLGGRWTDGREGLGETKGFGGMMERGIGLWLWRNLGNNFLFIPQSQRVYKIFKYVYIYIIILSNHYACIALEAKLPHSYMPYPLYRILSTLRYYITPSNRP